MQIVQETRTRLLLRLVKDEHFTEASRRKIAALVLELFGPTMTVETEFVDAIAQEASGKYRFCVSHVATDHLRGLSA